MEKNLHIILPTGQASKSSNLKIDLFSLFGNEKIACEQFLSEIIAAKRLTLQCTEENRALLRNIYFSSVNQVKTSGARKLNVSYPYYFEKSGGSLLYVPIAFIPIEINTEIAEEETYSINALLGKWHLNESLLHFLENSQGINFAGLRRFAHLENDFHAVIAKFTEVLSDKTGIGFSYAPNPVFPLLADERLAEQPDFETIFFNAAICSFEASVHVHTRFNLGKLNGQSFQKWYKAGLNMPDVSQFQAVNSVVHTSSGVLVGNSGSGKTFTVAHIVSAALAEGKKILVVSDRLKTLLQLQAEMEKWKLGPYTFILKDQELDLALLTSIAKAIAIQSADHKVPNYEARNYELAISRMKLEREKLTEMYANLQRKMEIAPNWQHLVGMFLKSEQIESRQLLNSHIHPKEFDYSEAEFLSLRESVALGQALFQKINTLEHPLLVLHPRLFTEMSCDDALVFLKRKIAQFHNRLQQSELRISDEALIFRNQQMEYYRLRFDKLSALAAGIRTRCEAGLNLYGASFRLSGFLLKIASWFSKKRKNKYELQLDIKNKIGQLIEAHQIDPPVNFDWSKITELKASEVLSVIHNFNSKLKLWYDGILDQVAEETNNLAVDSLVSSIACRDISVEFEQMLRDFNAAEIFAESIYATSNRLANYKNLGEQLLVKLESVSTFLSDFDAFYSWNQFFLNSDQNTQTLVIGLVKSNSRYWIVAFESWYFHHILQKNYSSTLPHKQQNFDELIDLHHQISDILSAKIVHVCDARRKESLRENEKSKLLEKYSSVAYSSLQEIFQKEQAVLTDFFPLLLATTALSKDVLNAIPFDLLIFEDAQNYALEQIGAIDYKQIIVCGDDFALSNHPDSVLNQALNAGFERQAISMVHTTEDNAMNALLDAVFPDESFHLPHSSTPSFFEAIHTEGFFDIEEKFNAIEAEKVLLLLNRIEKQSSGRFPSVGIICATIEQRDYISSLLLKIKQKRSAGFEKILHLERSNFGIFYWEECAGMHIEIAIVSLTFGIKDDKGRLSQQIQILNDVNGPEMLYVLLTRASKQLIFCHSITETYLQEFAASPTARGTYLLSQCFAYFKAIEQGQDNDANAILLSVADAFGVLKSPDPQLLYAEISRHLVNVLGEKRVVTESNFGSLAIPLLILPEDPAGSAVIVRLDGTFTLPYTPDPVWESLLVANIRSHGYVVIDTWSTDWWHDTKAALEFLLSKLDENNAGPGIKTNHEIKFIDEGSPLIDLAYHIDEEDPMFAEKVSDNTERNEAGAEPIDS
ncbi:MAG: DEAD/DEAH box helicase family protein [Saprospiraceae bacterium]